MKNTYKRIVIKVGTNVITQENGLLDLDVLENLVFQISEMKSPRSRAPRYQGERLFILLQTLIIVLLYEFSYNLYLYLDLKHIFLLLPHFHIDQLCL